MSNYIADQRYDGYHYIAPSSTSTSTPYFTRRNKPHEETKEQEPDIIPSTSSHTIPSHTELTMARITQLCRERDDMYTTPELNDVLMLNEMSIGEIKNLESFPHLITLFLNNNSITHISGLSHMTSLRSLFLQHNMITSMSGLESLTSLVTLNLSHNAITSIDIDMSRFTTLQTLDLSNNQIHDISRISTCTSIKVLNLAHNHLHDPIILTSTLPSLPHLRCLYLHHNPTLITATTQYRRMCMAHISTLTFLDDRPVTQHDRDASMAWLHGGTDAERHIRQQQSETKAEREQRQYDAWKQAREQKKHVIQETMVGYTHWEEEKQQTDVEEDEPVASTPTTTVPETAVVGEQQPETNIDESTLPPIFSASELALQASLATSERMDDLFNVLSHPTLDTYLSDIARTVPILSSDDDDDTEIEIYQVPDHVVTTRWGNEGTVSKTEPGNDAITKNEPILEVDVVDTLPSEASHPAPIRTDVDVTSPARISPHHHKQDVSVDKEKEKTTTTTTTTTETDDDVDVFAEIQPSTLSMTSTYPRNRAWAWMERDVQDIATSTSSPTKSHTTSTSTSTSTSDDIHVDMDLIELRMREYVQQQMSSMSVIDSKTEEEDVEDDAFWEELRQIQKSEKQ